jgi:hypothetical protein
MQYGPDQVPVSTKSIIVGPPLRGPAPVPVTTTTTFIAPPQFEPGPTLIDEPTNVIVTVPYVVSVSNNGSEIINRVTNLNFVGANVVSSDGANVTITITGGGSIAAGTGISVGTANNVTTVTNTFTETVYQGGNATGNLTPNRNNGTIQKFTLTGNITLNPPVNMTAGQSLTIVLTQDSTGSRLLNANVAYLFASGFQTLSTNSNGIDMLNIFSDGSTYYTTLTVDYS